MSREGGRKRFPVLVDDIIFQGRVSLGIGAFPGFLLLACAHEPLGADPWGLGCHADDFRLARFPVVVEPLTPVPLLMPMLVDEVLLGKKGL